jgi:hypothetical protein
VENTVGLVLEESKFSVPDNWLLFSIPNFLYCTFFFELVQAAVRFPESVWSSVRISSGANRQLKNALVLPSWASRPGPSVWPAIVSMNESMLTSSWNISSNVKFKERGKCESICTFLSLCVRVRNHKCLISWGLVRHIAHPLFLTKQQDDNYRRTSSCCSCLHSLCRRWRRNLHGRCATRLCCYDGDRHGEGR